MSPASPLGAHGIKGLLNNTDFLMVNAAYQPIIEMKVGAGPGVISDREAGGGC